jgi:hypothetical protein
MHVGTPPIRYCQTGERMNQFAEGSETVTDLYPKAGPVKGRKDAAKQEAVIETKVIKNNIDELLGRYQKMVSARDSFNDAVKTQAEKAGLMASVVRRYVTAHAKDKTKEAQRDCEQLSLLFLDVGI